jgi:hypothetical protein
MILDELSEGQYSLAAVGPQHEKAVNLAVFHQAHGFLNPPTKGGRCFIPSLHRWWWGDRTDNI